MSTSATFYVILAPQPPPPAPAVEGPVGTAEAPVTGPRDYRELVRALSPPFLARSVAARFMGLLGLVLDVVTQGAQLATLARSLYAPSFPNDALALVGCERMLVRYPAESVRVYRQRLSEAWRIWRQAGTQQGLLEQLEALGTRGARILQNDDLLFDRDETDWSRLFLVLPMQIVEDSGSEPGHRYRPEGAWGDRQVWGDGGTWGSSASASEVDLLRHVLHTFKPAHMRFQHVLVLFERDALDLADGTWDDPARRPDTIAFWDG